MMSIAGMSLSDENKMGLPPFSEFLREIDEWHRQDAQKMNHNKIEGCHSEKSGKQEAQDEALLHHGEYAKEKRGYLFFRYYLDQVAHLKKSGFDKVAMSSFTKNRMTGEVIKLKKGVEFDFAKWESVVSCCHIKQLVFDIDKLVDDMIDEQSTQSKEILIKEKINEKKCQALKDCSVEDFGAVLGICDLLEIFISDYSQSYCDRRCNVRSVLDSLHQLCEKNSYISEFSLNFITYEKIKLNKSSLMLFFYELRGRGCPNCLPEEVVNSKSQSLFSKRYT